MPRPPRIWFPGALYHVMVRGDNREPIFFNDADRRSFLVRLARAKHEYGCQLWAYVLMTNHVHLMLRTGDIHPVSKFMQSLNTGYTFHVHKKYRRVGHIFQGRFHSILVEKDTYALELTRYIHLNPVRAKMVPVPEAYRWSSYHAYLGGDSTTLVDVEEVLAMMSPVVTKQRKLYIDFVRDGLQERNSAFEQVLLTAPVLGSPEFAALHGVRHQARNSASLPIGV
ncbi:MAG: transposase [Candidatus Omnitrophota bacterium]|nr:transposase [Candidatus Omnitrophota bacterium]